MTAGERYYGHAQGPARAVLAPAGPDAPWHGHDGSAHLVQFYEAEAVLLDTVTAFLADALRAGGAGLVLATEAHRRGLEVRLQATGLDPAGAARDGRYTALDAAETLARFMVDGLPDPETFNRVIGGIVAPAAQGGRRVHIFGEMVALLVAEGNQAAACRLERLWNGLQQRFPSVLLCAYPMASVGVEALAGAFREICAEHSHVIPAESFTGLASDDDRLRAIAALQQQAWQLEAALAQRRLAEARLQEALAAERAAREAAEAALSLRDDFLSVAAHELRTPLTSLRGYAQVALRRLERDGGIPPDRLAHALRAITGQVDKLSRLITQILDISRLESGRLPLEREPTDLTALVEHAAAVARTWTDRHTITVDAPGPVEVSVDPLRLEQVLSNLLDNAVKYSPDGGRLEVAVSRTPDGAAEIAVRDYGLGIPPERRGQIFQRFYQAHRSAHRSGMGLGLYISRQIVERHGGEIRAEFPPEGGCRFVVRLPRDGDAASGPS